MTDETKRTNRGPLTRAEYLQVVGLLTLAGTHNQRMKEIEGALLAITGEINTDGTATPLNYGGYCGYAVWDWEGRGNADGLLALLGLAVESE